MLSLLLLYSILLLTALKWHSPHHELQCCMRGETQRELEMRGRKFTELPAQLVLLFSEHDPSHQSWCSTHSRCYNGPFIIALYEVMYLSRSVPLTAPLPQPGSRSQVPVVSWVIAANLYSPVIGLYIYTLFYARDPSSHCGLRRLSA